MAAGRKSLFTPETRQLIIQSVRGGMQNSDVCKIAGIGDRTLYQWLDVGEACIEGRAHPRKPKTDAERAEFERFAREYKTATAQGNLARISQINRAGQDTWTHRITGQMRFSVPDPVTYMNADTGKLVFEDPREVLPGDWIRQNSGEAWEHRRGEWQAAAWYLERTNPKEWARRTYIQVEGNLKIEFINQVITALIAADLSPADVFNNLLLEADRVRRESISAGGDQPDDSTEYTA